MPVQHIFLDMDGVLANFIAGASQLHGREGILDSWPRGVWDAPTVFGLSSSQFWRKIDAAGADFWAELEAYPWLPELLETLRWFGPVTILSSPSLGVECPSGKLRWLRQHVHPDFRDHLFGHQKHLCAKPGHVLIDDFDTNVTRFREHGGDAVLFPQPWNSRHAIEDRVAFVASELQRLA
jgi:hypothetical protein